MNKKLQDALWAGDVDLLQELAPCVCCCDEHTHPYCAARLWEGCRGGMPYGVSQRDEDRAWFKHYAEFHGMTENEFYGVTE